MTAPAPIRHPAPPFELRLEWPGQCWVWAVSRDWPRDFGGLFRSAYNKDVASISISRRAGWYIVRTRGPRPPWPAFIDQRDPGDERVEDDGFITVYTGPSEGYAQTGARP